MFRDYVDYEIEIQPRRDDIFPFSVRSPGGQATGELHLPTGDPVYQQLISRLIALNTTEAMLGQLGQILFKALFQGQAKEIYAGSQSTLQEDQGLRIKLNIAADESEVAALPWELLNDPDRGPLALLDMPVVRFLPQPIRIPTLKTTLPLKILLTGAQTPPPAQVERELAEIEKTLKNLGSQVQYVIEPHLTTSILRKRLREGFHVWHFVGHGGFIDEDATATLQFEDENGDLDEISATQLGYMLNRSVRLILLDACESGRLATDPFRSIAPALIRAQVPAVVAMQFPVSQASTRAFAREFYGALTEGFPIDACVTEARKAVVDVAGLRNPDWGIPVVYTRAPDGKLFDLPSVTRTATPASTLTTPQASGVNISFGDNNRVEGNNIKVDNVDNNTTTGSTVIQGDASLNERADRVASLNELLRKQRSNRDKLKLQAAGFGGSMWTPIALMNQIEDVEREISGIERELKTLGE